MWRRVRSTARALFGRARLEREMAEELRFHLDARADALIAAGMPPAEATRRARVELGALERVKEECRDSRGLRPFEDLRGDLAYAFRTIRRSPGFAAVAVTSLALGIGANALVFSIVNALVLRPLPIQAPERVFVIQTVSGQPGQSYPNYVDLRDGNTTFEGLAGYRIAPMSVESAAGTTRIWGYLATGNYFDVLGVQPLIGRFFHQNDDRRPGESPFAVLSYPEWQARFGGDAAVVGTMIRINKLPYTVIGVAPQGFHGTELFYRPAIWVPMTMQPQIEVGNPWLDRRQTFNTWIIGRLKSAVTPPQGAANLNGIAAGLARDYPGINRGLKLKLAQPGLVGDTLRGPVRAFTLGVLGLAGLVLLAACANLASLLTARASDRRREMAIRISLGAGRGRLVRQLLTESMVLALAGGASGAGLAFLAARALSAWQAPVDLPVQFDVTLDLRVLLFAFVVSTSAGVLFGVAPARRASRTDANAELKGGERVRLPWRRVAFRDVLVTIQVALCFVLVAACLLSLRGLQRALVMPLGFDPRGVAIAGFDVGLAGYGRPEGEALQRRIREEVLRLPGVKAAAYANSIPLSLDQSRTSIAPEGGPLTEGLDAPTAIYYQVSPGFFGALGVRRLAGRDFDAHDASGSPHVAIINQVFARQILRTDQPLGRRFRYRAGPLIEVIGVVEDGRYEALVEDPRPVVFKPILQEYNATTTMIARSSRPADELAAEMGQVIAHIDPGLPVYGAGSIGRMLGFALFPNRAAAFALGAFGAMALALAATGVYGLVSYSVARRVREIGIRIAVGASARNVLWVICRRTAALLAIGSAAGALLAFLCAGLLVNVVYQASPYDPVVFGAVALAMVLVGIVSAWGPIIRALRISPVSALKAE